VTKLTRLASLSVLLLAAACGDSGTNGDGGAGNADAGGDAGPAITGHTAKGVYQEALNQAIAIGEPDMRLFRISGEDLIASGREVDPTYNQSFWSFVFVSPSTGTTVGGFYNLGVVTADLLAPQNPEGLRFLDEWIDSDVAIDKLIEAGLTDLLDEELIGNGGGWTLNGTLEMYSGTSPDFLMAPQGLWRMYRIFDEPPLGDPVGEEWWVTLWEDQGGYVVCDPAGMCGVLP
jgi:hypothetical protein